VASLSVSGHRVVLLYHWTLADRAANIRGTGFRASEYDAAGDGIHGVSVSEHPTAWKPGNDTCLVIDVPDDVLDVTWRYPFEATPGVVDWRLPPEVATKYLVPE
jgi:hypothetical protein